MNGETDGNVIYNMAMAIREFDSFLILSHVRPDGDAIGSMLAFKHYLNQLGKDVRLYLADPVPQIYTFLPGADDITQDKPDGKYDVVISVDCNDEDRLGVGEPLLSFSKLVINVDHHPSNARFGALNCVKPEASSTAEIVMEIIESINQVIEDTSEEGEESPGISKDVATCLYVGLMTDTGRFQFRNATEKAFQCAARLVSFGANVADISRRVYMNMPAPKVRLLGYALQNVKIDGALAYISIKVEQMEKYLARNEHVDGIVNQIAGIAGVEIAALLHELKSGSVKVSLRSRGKQDVNVIAGVFGGGGHAAAAGFSLDIPVEEAEEMVLKELKSRLEAAKNAG